MSSVDLDSRKSQIHLWNQLKGGKIAFISNILSEVIGTIIQETPSTQITFDKPPNNLLKLDQIIVELQKKGQKREEGKVHFLFLKSN